MGKKTLSSINGAEKTVQPNAKEKKLDHYLTPYIKLNQKLI